MRNISICSVQRDPADPVGPPSPVQSIELCLWGQWGRVASVHAVGPDQVSLLRSLVKALFDRQARSYDRPTLTSPLDSVLCLIAI